MPQERKHKSPAHRQAAYRARVEKARRNQLQVRGLPALPAIPTMPGAARWNAGLRQAENLLSMIQEEMEAYFDDRSEIWQESERGEEHQERTQSVQEVLGTLSDLIS